MRMSILLTVVWPIPKVRLWKQITTETTTSSAPFSCMTYTKGTTLKANHNWVRQFRYSSVVVWPIPKVRLWKQITTARAASASMIGCMTYTKGTTLKANHNQFWPVRSLIHVVWPIPKVRLWKQITTIHTAATSTLLLYDLYQRYDFESKSQQLWVIKIVALCCMTYTKGTTLKANHNKASLTAGKWFVVWPIPKVRLWKQITTNTVIFLSI